MKTNNVSASVETVSYAIQIAGYGYLRILYGDVNRLDAVPDIAEAELFSEKASAEAFMRANEGMNLNKTNAFPDSFTWSVRKVEKLSVLKAEI